jgi:hypothetical protein
MEYLIGVVVAAVVLLFASLTGLDRDRVFYPILLIVIATYLFAVMGTSANALLIESMAAIGFVAMAVAGLKKNLRLVVAGLGWTRYFCFFSSCVD